MSAIGPKLARETNSKSRAKTEVGAREIWEWIDRLAVVAVLLEASTDVTAEVPHVGPLLKKVSGAFRSYSEKAWKRFQGDDKRRLIIAHHLVRFLEAIYSDVSDGKLTEAQAAKKIQGFSYEGFKSTPKNNRSFLWTNLSKGMREEGGPTQLALFNVSIIVGVSQRTLAKGRRFDKVLKRKAATSLVLQRVFGLEPKTADKIVDLIAKEQHWPDDNDDYFWRRILSPLQ